MAFVTVETPTGTYQAVVFPEVLSRYHAELIQLGPMEFFGEIQEEEPDADGDVLPTIVVDGLSRI
jgi:DNA polymerase III alpha subunit